MRKLLFGALAFTCVCSRAMATDPALAGYAVFSNGDVYINSNINATVASNADVTLGSFLTVNGINAGGSLLNSLGSSTINGATTVNDSVYTGGLTFNGPINAGNNVNLGAFYTSQSINAGNDVNLGDGTTTGNVVAGDDVIVNTFGQVNGNVSAGGTITNSGTISGSSLTNVTPANPPLAYTAAPLPPATTFQPSGPDINAGGTLAPGSYGNVTEQTFQTLTLSSGKYYFKSFNLPQSTDLQLNLTNGPIQIFVSGDVTSGNFVTTTVEGPGQSSYSNVLVNSLPNPANESLASQVLIESLGDINISGGDFGTLFAPNGSIYTASAPTIGSLIANAGVNVQNYSPVFYVQSDLLAPEPGSAALISMGFLALAIRARRPRRALSA